MPQLLTYKQAGERLGCSARSVKRLVDARKIPVVYPLPRSPRIPLDVIEDFITHLITDRYNATRAGQTASTEKRTCKQNVSKTATASISGQNQQSGMPVTPQRAAQELAEVLALPTARKRKRF